MQVYITLYLTLTSNHNIPRQILKPSTNILNYYSPGNFRLQEIHSGSTLHYNLYYYSHVALNILMITSLKQEILQSLPQGGTGREDVDQKRKIIVLDEKVVQGSGKMEDTQQFLYNHDRANTFAGETIGRIAVLLKIFDAISNLSKRRQKAIKIK